MTIRIPLDAAQLAGTRFAVYPVAEVVWTLWRPRPQHARPHARRWHARAKRNMDPAQLALLEALVPADHGYLPDFLLPYPTGARDPIDELTDRIANADPDLVERHLDFALAGRPVLPDAEALFPSPAVYRAWRRPIPPALAAIIERGPRVVAKEAAEAMQAFFDVAIAPDWPIVEGVLLDDIAHRADQTAASGAGRMIGDLHGSVHWRGASVEIEHRCEQTVDWPHSGPVLIPCASQDVVSFGAPCLPAEAEAFPPLIIYPARGYARLDDRSRPVGDESGLADLIGSTRLDLVSRLGQPRSTQALGVDTGLSSATVSYHLGILADSGLVTKARRGRHVLYRRTAKADALLATTSGG